MRSSTRKDRYPLSRKQRTGWVVYALCLLTMIAWCVHSLIKIRAVELQIANADRISDELQAFRSEVDRYRQFVKRTGVLLASTLEASDDPKDFPTFDYPKVIASISNRRRIFIHVPDGQQTLNVEVTLDAHLRSMRRPAIEHLKSWSVKLLEKGTYLLQFSPKLQGPLPTCWTITSHHEGLRIIDNEIELGEFRGRSWGTPSGFVFAAPGEYSWIYSRTKERTATSLRLFKHNYYGKIQREGISPNESHATVTFDVGLRSPAQPSISIEAALSAFRGNGGSFLLPYDGSGVFYWRQR